jgi:acetolactate synthase-1/2/3 large subunit
MLCEVMVDPNYIFVPKLSSRILDDGTMVSSSLEDMYPFLNANELRDNIINDKINAAETK